VFGTPNDSATWAGTAHKALNSDSLGGSAAAAYVQLIGDGTDSLGNYLVVEAVRFRAGGALLTGVDSLTDGTNIAVDGSKGPFKTVTLGGNRAISNPTNVVIGMVYTFEIIQDATGGRTLTWGASYCWTGAALGGVAPTLTSTGKHKDLVVFTGTPGNTLSVISFAPDVMPIQP